MNAFITALTGEGGISSTTLWSEVTYTVPLLVILIAFAFGYNVVRKNIKGASKGKVRM